MSLVYKMSDSRLVSAIITIVFLTIGAIVGAYSSGSANATPRTPQNARVQCEQYCEAASGELAEMGVTFSPQGASISCVCFFGAVDLE